MRQHATTSTPSSTPRPKLTPGADTASNSSPTKTSSLFRQQITSSGISPSSTDTYDRMLYDTLLRPITTNRRDSTKYPETKNITELSGLCVHTLSSARAAHWHPPSSETKEERARNRRRQAQPETAPPNPQQGNNSYPVPYNTGNTQQGNFGAQAPGPPQRFVHPSFTGGRAPPAPPRPKIHNRTPNPDGTLNCFSCGKTHKDLLDCPLHHSKIGQSPFRGATDPRGRLLCLGCGDPKRRMTRRTSGPAPPGTPPGTVGFTYHGMPGPAHKAHGNMADRVPPPPPPDSSLSRSGQGSQNGQSGCLAFQQHPSMASHSAYSFSVFGDSGLVEDDDSSQDDD